MNGSKSENLMLRKKMQWFVCTSNIITIDVNSTRNYFNLFKRRSGKLFHQHQFQALFRSSQRKDFPSWWIFNLFHAIARGWIGSSFQLFLANFFDGKPFFLSPHPAASEALPLLSVCNLFLRKFLSPSFVVAISVVKLMIKFIASATPVGWL